MNEAMARRAFLDEYAEDLRRGVTKSLAEYLARYPDHPAAITEEFECIEDEGDVTTGGHGTRPDGGADARGERIGGYTIVEELGRGGQAIVYRARDEGLGRDVALKVLSSHIGLGEDSPEFLRFRREAEGAARLDHPGICTVYGAGQEDGLAYIAMRFVRGETLARRIARSRERGDLAVSMLDLSAGHRAARTPAPSDHGIHPILALIERCARALHEAHEHGLVHRDVKPGNIMVGDDDQPVLLDFGIASLESSDHALTGSGAQLGTPYYMAPEQVRGASVDRRTDVYALGAVLYECLTLRRPFEAASREALFRQILDARPTPVRRLNPRVARDLQVVVEVAMDQDAPRRYPTALALAQDLERLRSFQPIVARPIGRLLRLRRWTQRHPARTAATVIAALAFVVALLLWYRAENALDDWERLADLRRVQDLEREADADLWPVRFENAARMRAWLDRADGVLARRGIHERRREVLRTAALPGEVAAARAGGKRRAYEAEMRQLDAAIAELDRYTAELRAARPDHENLGTLDGQAIQLRAARTQARVDFETRSRWVFPDADLEWQHDVLSDLLGRFDHLSETRADVAKRLATATALQRRSAAAGSVAAWDRARRAIADSARYAGIALDPQPELLPLRADPESGLWEFALLTSGEPPEIDAEGRYRLRADTALVLVLIPAGEFTMGTPLESVRSVARARPWGDEQPPRRVALAAFFLSKYEMTQGQWERVTGSNPSVYRPPRSIKDRMITALHPVENIQRAQANETLRRLGLQLPTEAQWEYAARGGTAAPWWTGAAAQSLEGAANLADRQFGNPPFEEWLDDGHPCHAPVGSFRANGFGLHDVAGNVWEWCLDNFAPYGAPAGDGDGRRPGWDLKKGIRRGGSWMSVADDVRTGRRRMTDESFRNGTLGVRPARALDPSRR